MTTNDPERLMPRATTRIPWAPMLGLMASLPLIWGYLVPWFLALDPISTGSVRLASIVAGLVTAAAWCSVSIFRLRQQLDGGFPYRAARDLIAFVLATALARWLSGLGDIRLPNFENFAILSCQIGTGFIIAVTTYFEGRRSLRRARREVGSKHLPALNTITTLNATVICVILACLLGVGLTARSAGRLSNLKGNALIDIAERIGAELALAKDEQKRNRILSIWRRTEFIFPELVKNNDVPSWLGASDRMEPTAYGFYALSPDGSRWHIVTRPYQDAVLWLGVSGTLSPPATAPEFAFSLVFLIALLFGSPLAAWLAALEIRNTLRSISDGLKRLGNVSVPASSGTPVRYGGSMGGIPIPGNDEAGDLATHLNDRMQVHTTVQRALLRELNLAAQSNEAQNIFLRSASDELQEPLRSIRQSCTELAAQTLNQDQLNDLAVIDQAAEQLNDHVRDILMLSELDHWQDIPLDINAFDMNELATEVMTRLADRAKPTIKAEIAAADDVPLVHADRKRITQVLSNLIENAFKYTDSGYVRVTTIRDHFDDGRAAVHVSVWDSGPGIPSAEQETIFDEFYRVSEQRDRPGTGLGLAIAKRLVDRHDGKLWVVSVEGEGSNFHLLLPLEPGSGGTA
ncbi:MAG: HAMP domain-containing sensor histidine kinase [Myxococcota bacterium]|nr:HAMP domain-containing sensor histidine kinase [Myxococcota bacterium]